MSFVPQFADFEGEWRIERSIDDRLGRSEGRFSGRSVFRPLNGGLCYREEGVLTLGGGPGMVAVREYVWREEEGRIHVAYHDGRPFHDFDPADPQARHVCVPDDYRVRYEFGRWPDWTAVWVVSGPRKDYTMISRYSRPPAGGE